MNSIVVKESAGFHAGHAVLGWLRFVFDAIRTITWREFVFFLLLSLLLAGMRVAWLVEVMMKKSGKTDLIAIAVVMSLMVLPFALASWAVADRSTGTLPRPWRLTFGVLAGSALMVLCAPFLMTALGIDLAADLKWEEDGKVAMIPPWAYWTATFLDVSFFIGIGVAVLEAYRRRTRAQRALEAARQEQARLARGVLESRLAAMQAQVEPHFLFDSLVDVQATYDHDAERGADVMDRLITYLRVALPRLRESGSTVQAEVDLLAAYLAVVAARHAGLPVARFRLAPECANARFSPMLLLPLVQRAMRGAGNDRKVPQSIELDVRNEGNDVIARLRIEAPGLCAEDAELARVRDRLAGLYDGRSRLSCEELQPGVSQFTLRVPH